MAIQNVNNQQNANYLKYVTENNKSATDLEKLAAAQQPAVPDVNTSVDGDKYVPSEAYEMDTDKVSLMQTQMWNKVDVLEKMVNALFEKQGIAYDASIGMKRNLENLISGGGVSEADRLAAEKAIGEDGEWGVNKTAERIMDFAKALSGGDPSKIEELRDAVKAGFDAAKKVWGDELPDICQQTYDKVMKDFDDWAATFNTQE